MRMITLFLIPVVYAVFFRDRENRVAGVVQVE